jgi:hypothetical protein
VPTQLHDRRASLDPFRAERGVLDDRRRVPFEKLALRAGDAVPRQAADRLEQTRAERIVEILRLQLLRRQLQIAGDVRGKLSAERPF